MSRPLAEVDPEVFEQIRKETERQNSRLELIASENFTSEAILEAAGSVFTNKYAEGYPGKRYYGGCEYIDVVENLARDRAKKLFRAEYANVQPHSGSQANQAAYASVLESGRHHPGHEPGARRPPDARPSAQLFRQNVQDRALRRARKDDETHRLRRTGARWPKSTSPKMIIAGGSAYPRIIDFARFRQIADSVGAIFLVDMAHFSGLVAAGLHPNPCEWADIVTSTTHKTLRGRAPA